MDAGFTLTESVVKDPYFTSTVIHYPLVRTANEGGRALPEFGPGEPVDVIVRPAAVADFSVEMEGQRDADSLYMLAADEYGIDDDDRIRHRGQYYRATERQIETIDAFSLFVLVEDSRDSLDDEQDRTDTTDTDTGTDSGSGSGSGDRDYEVVG